MEKYVNIIMQRKDREEFISCFEILKEAFKDKKTLVIINAVGISLDKKIEFLVSLSNTNKKEIINFLKVLGVKNKLDKVPVVYDGLVKKLALENNIYYADIYSKEKISDNDILKHEKELSNYFKKEIKLKNIIHDKNEIKIYIEDLGYEIIVSETSLKDKIKQHIMKAI